eukprot:Em0013g273a
MDSARAPVNLDKIISDFNVWEEAAAAVLQENNRLSLQVKHLQRQCTLYQEAEKCYINDITLLRCSTERLQNALAKRCDFENENAALRDQIVALHKSTVLLEMEHKKQIAESLDTLKAAHEAHKTELLRAQELVQRQSKQEIEVLQRQIQEKNAELRQIQKQLSDVERDRHTEVVKLRLEVCVLFSCGTVLSYKTVVCLTHPYKVRRQTVETSEAKGTVRPTIVHQP